MSSKNIQYKVNGVPTSEQIEKFNSNENIFFRFQDPYCKLTSRSKSWVLSYCTEQEAIRNCENDGLSPDEAILNGKSCMATLEELMEYEWIDNYDNDFVLLVFEGENTGETGHDGEIVAKYHKKIAVWSYDDVMEYVRNNSLNQAV